MSKTTKIIILVNAVVLVVLAGWVYVATRTFCISDIILPENNNIVSTTGEVKNDVKTGTTIGNTQTETVQWKILRNRLYTIKYPMNWYILEERDTDTFSNVETFTSEVSDKSLQNESFFRIYVEMIPPNKENLSIEKWYDQQYGFLKEIHESAIVNGRPAIKAIDSEGLYAGSMLRYYVSYGEGKGIVTISFLSKQTKFIQIYEQMLSSFEFLY